jgi:MoxR-like ATPase
MAEVESDEEVVMPVRRRAPPRKDEFETVEDYGPAPQQQQRPPPRRQQQPAPQYQPAPRGRVDQGEGIPIEEFAHKANMLKTEVQKAIIGKSEVIDQVMIGLLSDGNLLLEDYPGLAKTLLANTFARALGCDFKRIQFTPDLMPSDITGTKIFDEQKGEFYFERGPIFTNILLADEINRAPPKTQAALLEAMQERQVSIGGKTYQLPRPFIVMATQNPIEYEGTYPLPEAQLDRFMMKLSIGYPSIKDEDEILRRRVDRQKDDVDINQLLSPKDVVDMQNKIEGVYVEDSLRRYIVNMVSATRNDNRVAVGSSPRGSLALLKLARARAILNNRGFITPDDIKAVVLPGLRHRLILKPEFQIKGVEAEDVIVDVVKKTNVPKVQNFAE